MPAPYRLPARMERNAPRLSDWDGADPADVAETCMMCGNRAFFLRTADGMCSDACDDRFWNGYDRAMVADIPDRHADLS